jgi:tRNA (cmo5U34)-methyltransferase
MDDTIDFSFADHAAKFDPHIRASIPGYKDGLLPTSIRLSRTFVQPGTRVVDIGCSTGHLIASIRKANRVARPDVEYVGIDLEPNFGSLWDKRRANNLRCEVTDARTYSYDNTSLVTAIFTLQFVRPMDKHPLLRRIFDGLVAGGALIIAEKTLAESPRLQDALAFPYYDHKLENGFSPAEILDKERGLRGRMKLWTETELKAELSRAGFREINPIWRSFMFVGLLALK